MVIRDKEGHYIKIKGSMQEENITIVNIYAPITGTLPYIMQLLTATKGEIDNNIIILEDLPQWTDHQDRKSTMKHRP